MIKSLDCSNCRVKPISCFHILSRDDLIELNGNKFSTLFRKGQIIFHEGFYPTGVYCLKSGKVKIYKVGSDGKEQIVRFVIPGGLLGIRALISGREYMASATALEDSVVCHIKKTKYLALIKKYPEISHCVMITLSRLLEEAEERMTSLAQKPVRERLAESLLILNKVFAGNCQGHQSMITLSREDLANIVGTATETVIRLLSEFKEENLVAVYGRQIKLVNIAGLMEIAGF